MIPLQAEEDAGNERADRGIARRVAQEQGLPVLGTAQVLRQVSDRLGTSRQDVAEMLERVQRRSRFRPRRGDPEAQWWQGLVGR